MRYTMILVLLASLAGCANRQRAEESDSPWARINASTDGSQIVAWKTLARHCDAWYGGSRPQIDLRFEDGHVYDDAGHRMVMSAPDFKGIVQAARIQGGKVEAFASMSEIYSSGRSDIPQDKFGRKPRYRYRVTAVSDDVLRYEVIERLDA